MREDSEIYVLKNSKSNNKINNEHDKIFRKILEVLIILIEQILAIEIGEEKAKEIIKILKGGNRDMLNCIESAYRENRVLFNNGIKTGIEKGRLTEKIEIIKELLKIKMPISQISQITHLTEDKIKEIENNNKTS